MENNLSQKILIDTDLGDDIDDAAALIMALNSPELEIVGITTVYLDTVKRAQMVLELCSKYGRNDIPVCAGYGRAIIERADQGTPPTQYEVLEENRESQIVTECDGPEFIIRQVKKYPDLIIVAIGCMTNLAIAFYREPEIMKQARIVAMGGVFLNSSLEWNIICDPEAARIVMDYAGQLEMFGLDVTKYCRIPDNFMTQLCPEDNERMQYFKKGVRIFQEKTGYSCTFHDVLVIAYLLDSTVAEMEQDDFTVELAGARTRGSIVFNTNAYDINKDVRKKFYYAKSIDVEKFMKMVKERIF